MEEDEILGWLESDDFAKDVDKQAFRTKVKNIARSCSRQGDGFPTPEQLQALRDGGEVVMELSAMLKEAVANAGVAWSDLHFAGSFANGRVELVAGGLAASDADRKRAAEAVSRMLEDNDLTRLVRVAL